MTAVRTARAYAKINLALAVAPPEPPGSDRAGWHRIASWMAPIALHDDVTVEPLEPGATARLDIRWADDAPLRAGQAMDWAPEQDLAWRAHALLEAETGRDLACAMTIRKRICAGAGLGGGSSDAAVVLQLLDGAFDLGLEPVRLRALSVRLGSDIAYFIDEDVERPPRAALIAGFGDVAQRCPAPPGKLVLIIPDFGCSTPAVYRAFDGLDPGPLRAQAVSELAASGAAALSEGGLALFNDLGPAAEAVEPRLAALRAAIAGAAGRPIHITGSGSAMFALCAPDEAPSLVERLAPIAAPGAILATTIVSESGGDS